MGSPGAHFGSKLGSTKGLRKGAIMNVPKRTLHTHKYSTKIFFRNLPMLTINLDLNFYVWTVSASGRTFARSFCWYPLGYMFTHCRRLFFFSLSAQYSLQCIHIISCRANETRSNWTRSIFSMPMRRVPIGRVPMRRVPNRRVYYIGRYIHAVT